MASSIPRTARRRYANYLAGLNLYVALFLDNTGYDEVAASNTYTNFISNGATEVADASYTVGGYQLVLSTDNGTGNTAVLKATPTIVASATWVCRYAVIYIKAAAGSDHIEAVIDFGSNKTVTSGTMTITWDSTNGIIKIS